MELERYNFKDLPTSLQITTQVPTTDADMRKYYLDGRRSITNNLPRPNIYFIGNHSYVSIRECIAHFFALGRDPHPIPIERPSTCTSITDSAAAFAARGRGYEANADVAQDGVTKSCPAGHGRGSGEVGGTA